MIKYIALIAAFFCFCSCAPRYEFTRLDGTIPREIYTVDITSEKNGNVTTVYVTSDFIAYYYFSMDNNTKKFTIDVTGSKFKLGHTNLVRPISGVKTSVIENGLRLVLTMGTTETFKYESIPWGLKFTMTSQEPDMEAVSMDRYGGWTDSNLGASNLTGIDTQGQISTLNFDGMPRYAQGNDGGRYYLDIYGVYIPQGNIRLSNVTATSSQEDKTRIFFKQRPDICPTGNTMLIGQQCTGYGSIFGFKKEKKNGNESFSFTFVGNPQVTERTDDNITAFGFKNMKLFGNGLNRYNDDNVYKMETRSSEGLTWLVFLHQPGMKYKKYINGDKFFVVFYK